MINIQIFTVQKNEETIRDWLNYHGNIFGFNNIHFIDNNSDEEYKNILNDYKIKYGLNVYELDDFRRKGEKLSEIMNKVKDDSNFLIPLDGDEFIGIKEEEQLLFDKQLILNYIDTLSLEYKYKFIYYLNMIDKKEYEDPLTEIMYFREYVVNTKAFYPSRYFISTDQGNHHGKILNNNETLKECNLVLLHFHFKGYKHLISKTEKFAEGYNEWKDGAIGHMTQKYEKYKNNTLEEWYENIIHFDHSRDIEVVEFSNKLIELRIKNIQHDNR